MPTIQRSLFAVTLALASSYVQQAAAQDVALEAELPRALSADSFTPGSSFALKVITPWHDGQCSLVPGSMLHAVVVRSEHNQKGRINGVAFSMQTACGEEQPLNLVVTSLLAPVEVESLSQQFFRSSSFGGGTGLGQSGNTQSNHVDMSGRQNPTLPVSNGDLPSDEKPKAVHLGEVWHIPRVKLVVPSAGGSISTITTSGSVLSLGARTVFVLQGAHLDRQRPAVMPASLTKPSAAVERGRRPFISPCVATHCTRYASSALVASFGAQRLGSGKDLASLGFRGAHDRELREMDNGTTVHFLGHDELLVTFPSHRLLKRAAGARDESHPRSIRAVLLDASTLAVRSVQDWNMDDSNAYIWPLGQNVLVHEQQSLRLFGPGLQEIATFPLTQPLAVLRSSPDGDHLLMGQVHELHTAEEHSLLVQADARGPEEQVSWFVLDGKLMQEQMIGVSSSFRLPPVLMNSGVIELRKEGKDRWHLVHSSWDLSKEERLGTFESSCLPTLGSTAPDLLVLSTCDTRDLGAHTFFLHEDGTPVLDHAADWHDLPLHAASASDAQRLAVLVTRGKEEYTRGRPFRLDELRSQTAEVMSSSDGTVLASVPLTEFSPIQQAVALSPDGVTLAVLSGSRVFLYDVQH